MVIAAIFVAFLAIPMVLVLVRSVTTADGGLTAANFAEVLGRPEFLQSIANSFVVSAAAALVSVALAFLLSYTINCTNVPPLLKRAIGLLAQLPMLLPTITYGFAIIYTFGRTGLLTRLLGFQLFDIYGFNGLLLGYVIYTLPTAFLLVDNSFRFIDKRFMIVSRVMGDSPLQTFVSTVLRPLAGALCVAFVQSFFLAFTDYSIPTSVGSQYDVVALELYNQMLGALPDFNKGAVIAVVMLIPSVASIILMAVLERFAIRYNKVTPVELEKSRVRDGVAGGLSVAVIVGVLSVFLVILIVPFIEMCPTGPTSRSTTWLLSSPTPTSRARSPTRSLWPCSRRFWAVRSPTRRRSSRRVPTSRRSPSGSWTRSPAPSTPCRAWCSASRFCSRSRARRSREPS